MFCNAKLLAIDSVKPGEKSSTKSDTTELKPQLLL